MGVARNADPPTTLTRKLDYGRSVVSKLAVSVPEKTLEHWVSQYVNYRYRTKAALWWPAQGEDIDVQSLPHLPGKALQLEVKTTTLTKTGRHKVLVDIGQLKDYLSSPVPAFYVFPKPTWPGLLTAAASAAGISAPELAFSRISRHGPGWWVADWLIVMTAREVARVLSAEVAAHAGTTRKNFKRLVTFTVSKNGPTVPMWAHGLNPKTYAWRDFWTKLESCGEPGWPQLLRLPAGAAALSHPTQGNIRRAFRQVAEKVVDPGLYDGELVSLIAGADGEYAPFDDQAVAPIRPQSAEDDHHRQVVFLDARAIA